MDIRMQFSKFDMWSSWLQKDIDKDRTVMDTINALVVVAAFIAGVQGQVIQFTLTLSLSPLGRSSNFFAFSGLMLDIIGTFSGVIHALVLQHRINKSTAVLNYVTQTKAGTEAIQAIDGGKAEEHQIALLQQRLTWLENEMWRRFLHRGEGKRTLPMLARMFPSAVAPPPIPMEDLPGSKHAGATLLSSVMPATPFQLGHTPLISMGLGVIALVISIVLFTAETTSLATEVWITCVVVPFTVIFFSLMPITYSLIKRKLKQLKMSDSESMLGDN